MPIDDEELQGASQALPTGELSSFARQMREISLEAETFSRHLTQGVKAAVVDGKSLQQIVSRLALDLSARQLTSALKPLESLAGHAVSRGIDGLGTGLGTQLGRFAGQLTGQITPFARGGVVGAPAVFSMENGLGVAGEAGAEAILPLTRGQDGRLGVRSGGGTAAPVTINVTTRDADTFVRARTQVAAMAARAVGRGRRGL